MNNRKMINAYKKQNVILLIQKDKAQIKLGINFFECLTFCYYDDCISYIV